MMAGRPIIKPMRSLCREGDGGGGASGPRPDVERDPKQNPCAIDAIKPGCCVVALRSRQQQSEDGDASFAARACDAILSQCTAPCQLFLKTQIIRRSNNRWLVAIPHTLMTGSTERRHNTDDRGRLTDDAGPPIYIVHGGSMTRHERRRPGCRRPWRRPHPRDRRADRRVAAARREPVSPGGPAPSPTDGAGGTRRPPGRRPRRSARRGSPRR